MIILKNRVFEYRSKFLDNELNFCLASEKLNIFKKTDSVSMSFSFPNGSYNLLFDVSESILLHFFINKEFSLLSICCQLNDLNSNKLKDLQVAYFIKKEEVSLSVDFIKPSYTFTKLEFLQNITSDDFEFFVTKNQNLIVNLRFKSSNIPLNL